MVRLWSSGNAGKLLRCFLFTVCNFLNLTRFMTLDSPSCVFPFNLSGCFLHGSLLLQVWYPSPGANPFKQEDFLQVYISRKDVQPCRLH